jgi:DNA uptake protein ComE-like DNA-binding protein
MAVRNLMRMTGAVLLVILILIVWQSRPAEPQRIKRAAIQQNGVTRLNGRVLIDLNRADETLLEVIPGIGPVLAARIRALINEKGTLTAPEDLLEVEGVGPAKLRAIEAAAVVMP